MQRKIKDFVLGIRIYILQEKLNISWEEKKEFVELFLLV